MRQLVVLTADFPPVAVEILSREFEVVQHPSELKTEEELITILGEADGALTVTTDPLTRKVIASNPNLRVISNCAPGTDNIDLEAAAELGVVVTNTPGALTPEGRAEMAARDLRTALNGGRPTNGVRA